MDYAVILVFGIVCMILALVNAVIALVLLRLIRRHERLRAEMAQMVAGITDGLTDLNGRLIAAGYPPGRTMAVPSTYPQWAGPSSILDPANPRR